MLSTLCVIILAVPTINSNIISCYYRWREPELPLVDFSICTHIILIGQAYVDLLGKFHPPPDEVSKMFAAIKKINNNVKLLHSIIGQNTAFSTMVESTSSISRFANESYTYLSKFGFDGLDIDWEFPSWGSHSRRSDKIRFTMFLKALRERFGFSLMITLAVSGPPTISRVAYDVPALNKYCDLVQVMNYDFHVFSYFHPVVGFNAPLRKLHGELGVVGEMNSEASMSVWSSLGLWKNKTVFGIPTYGQAFRLINWRMNLPFALASGTVDGYENYPVVCSLIKNKKKYTYVWSERAASPYVYGTDKLWLSIEDVRSVSAKAEYAKDLRIAGVMVFHIGSDDVTGSCGNGKFPLLKAVQKIFM